MNIVGYVIAGLFLVAIVIWGTRKFSKNQKIKVTKNLPDFRLQPETLKIPHKLVQQIQSLAQTSLVLEKLDLNNFFKETKFEFLKYDWKLTEQLTLSDLTNFYGQSQFNNFLKLIETNLNEQQALFMVTILNQVNQYHHQEYQKLWKTIKSHYNNDHRKTLHFFEKNYLTLSKIYLKNSHSLLISIFTNLQKWNTSDEKYFLALENEFMTKLTIISNHAIKELETLIELEHGGWN